MKHQAVVLSVLALAGLSLNGCVAPGEVSPEMLYRYQRALAERGPQPRSDQYPLWGRGSLVPASESELPPLDVRKGEQGEALVDLTLEQAILRALVHNVDLRVASYDPAISREDMVRASAEFDATVNAGFTYANNDRLANQTFGLTEVQSEERTFTAGLGQKLITGGSYTATWSMTRTWDNQSTARLRTRYEPELSFTLNQPLLRNAWPEFNLANLRIARLSYQTSEVQFRRNLEQTIVNVISAYWQLRQARTALDIQKRLLEVTRQTYDRVKEREQLDATQVQIKQAEAAVESRRAVLIRTQKLVRDAQDALLRILADPQLNLLTEAEVLPVTDLVTAPVTHAEADQLLNALYHNPQLQQLRLAVRIADLTVTRARNQKLPKLDLTAGASLQGLDGARHQSLETWGTLDYFSSSIGITFEYPIGNRLRKADYRKAVFERLQAIAELQSAADQVAQQVRERIREIQTAHKEYLAQQAVVAAAKAQLQALEDTERIRGRLTPEFLQLKLSAQETVAAAERGQIDALVNYNTAMVELAQVTGTVMNLPRTRILLPKAAEQVGVEDLSELPPIPVEPAEPVDKPGMADPDEQDGDPQDGEDAAPDAPAN